MSDKPAQVPATETPTTIYAKVKEVFEKAAGDPTKIVSALQALRNQSELDGDQAATDAYTEAIKLVQQAAGLTQEPEKDEAPEAEAAETPAEQAAEAEAGAEQAAGEISMAAMIAGLSKAGRTFSSKNASAMHTAIKTLAAALAGAGDPVAQNVVKAYGASPAEKAAGIDAEALAGAISKAFAPLADAITAQVSKSEAVLANLQRQPAPGGPVLTPVEKTIGAGSAQAQAPAVLTATQELDTLQKMLDGTQDVSMQQAIRQRMAVINVKIGRGLA